MSELGDQFYVRRCLAGDREAYGVLVRRYQHKLYAFARRMVKNPDDAGELALVALEKAYFALAQYRPRYAFSTWIYRIIVNEAIDFLKECRRERIDREGVAAFAAGPLCELEQKEFWDKIEDALDMLPAEQRSVFVLWAFDGLTVDEIADIHRSPRGTVCWRLMEARNKMAQQLRSYFT